MFKRCDHLRKSFEQREMMMIVVRSLKSLEALAGDAILRYFAVVLFFGGRHKLPSIAEIKNKPSSINY